MIWGTLITAILGIIGNIFKSITKKDGSKLSPEEMKQMRKEQKNFLRLYRKLAEIEPTNYQIKIDNPYVQVVRILTLKERKRPSSSSYNNNTKLANALAYLSRSTEYKRYADDTSKQDNQRLTQWTDKPVKMRDRGKGYDIGSSVYFFGKTSMVEWGNVVYYPMNLIARDIQYAFKHKMISGPLAVLLSLYPNNPKHIRSNLFARGLTYIEKVSASAYFGYALNGYFDALDWLTKVLKPFLMEGGAYVEIEQQRSQNDYS
jgi:hypothetical protein